jgi:opacity protein-like surface antigen
MSSPKTLVRSLAYTMAFGAGLTVSVAAAADLDFPAAQEAPPVEQYVEFGTGWYIRGDLAYARDTLPNVGELGTFPNGAPSRNTFAVGLGGGYKFTNWFRADVTADFRQPLQSSDTTTGTTIIGWRWDALANGYIDIGTWYGFTPYVGAGVGATWGNAKLTTFDSIFACTQNGTVECFTERTPVSFAWALMAGVSYQVMPHVYLDMGYRYLNLGNYSFWSPSQQPAISAITGNAASARSQVQEFRLGVRYMID